MSAIRQAAMLAATILLAGCVSQPVRQAVPADPAQVARLDLQRGEIEDWQLAGRVAVSNGSQGGSGRIDWQQRGGHYEISLSAPVTRKSWRLAGDANGARLEGIDGGPREDADVEGMLFAATGWDIPVRALVAWVRGVGAAEGFAAARPLYAGSGLPVTIEQGGWQIEYRDWHPAEGNRPALPKRIEAASGNAKVRLIIDRWHLEEPLATAPGTDAGDTPESRLRRVLAGLDLADPAADMRVMVAAGDRRPVGVCGFACLAPGYDEPRTPAAQLRIIDGTGDVVRGDAHLALKRQAAGYARAYNLALQQWLRNDSGPAAPANPGPGQ